ncbi:MAG: hypothetical protein WBB94_02565 [Candidatus Saccharimonadaceae bacterium]
MKESRYRKEAREFADKHVNPKLRRSLRIYFVVAVIIFIFVVINTIRSGANPMTVLLGLIAGVLIGVLFNRIYRISWDKKADHAIYKMDIFGIVLLVAYIAFDLSRGHLVELFIDGNSVAPTSLALLAGAFYGRVLGTGREIIRVFKEEKIL